MGYFHAAVYGIFDCSTEAYGHTSIVRIHKNEQLLDWPFTRLLLEVLYIKTSNYLQVKGIDF